MRNQKFQTPRIVQEESRGNFSIWLLALILLGAWTWQVFEYGRKQGGFDIGLQGDRETRFDHRIRALQSERDELRLSAAKFERAAQIDRAAVLAAQEDLKRLQDEKVALRKEVDLLNSLLSGNVTKLQVHEFAVEPVAKANTFSYKFTISKRAEGSKRVSGDATISIHGQLDGEEASLSMDKLGMQESRHRLGFKHFQKLDGEITLPAGFIPASFEVDVQPEGKVFKRFQQSFEWSVSDT